MVPQMWDEKTRAVTDCPYSTADERSRARKGADARIPAREAMSARHHRRAVDCAPYLALRFCVFALKMRTREAMRPYQYNIIFLGRDAPARRRVGVAVQLLLCCGARPSWPQCFQVS